MKQTPSELSGKPAADSGVPNSNIGQPTFFRIVRSGARPIRFSGSELAMAMSFTPEIPFWYEINLYRTTETDFVAAVRLFHQSEERRDTVEAWQFKSLDEALSAIEHYDAAADVEFEMPDWGDKACGPDIAARALELRARIECQRRHYRGLVGEILYELDAA
jgi:hypothetical protein